MSNQDTAALDWERLSQRSRREARRRTTDPSAADDIAQEALIRAWRAWSRGARPEVPEAWLVTITRHEAARWHGGPDARSWRATNPTPEMCHEDDEPQRLLERAHVRHVVDALRPEDRLLLHLRYGEDLTHAQLAERLGTPEGTAKVRLHRLRQRLRKQLSS